ncbi:MAG TPA: DEAD/DEAH box helicase [Kofleriaceae bacterium]|nr:DEAD/DEAH box helicase [Kofleriaceae bacterium]
MSDAGSLHVVFLPDWQAPRFFVWGSGAASSALAAGGRAERARVVGEELRAGETAGVAVPLLDGVARLARMTAADAERAPASLAVWSAAAKLALELVARERLVPRMVVQDGGSHARTVVALARTEDADRVLALARAFPLAAHCVPAPATAPVKGRKTSRSRPAAVWAAEALVHRFLDMVADSLVRAASAGARRSATSVPGHVRWERRLMSALTGPTAAFAPEGFGERSLATELEAWARPALGSDPGAPRLCLRLDLPGMDDGEEQASDLRPQRRASDLRPQTSGRSASDPDHDHRPQPDPEASTAAFPLRFFLQAADDPSLLVSSATVLRGRGRGLRRLGFPAAEEHLLRSLAAAARLFAPVERGLRDARPEAVALDVGEAWAFLSHGAPALTDAGIGVILPAELTRSGQRRLRLRMRVGATGRTGTSKSARAGGLGFEEVTAFRWEVALAGQTLSERELRELARLKAPLVRFRGRWVAVDPAQLEEARRLLAEGGGQLAAQEALAAALSGSGGEQGGVPVDVVAEGRLAEMAARLRRGADTAGASDEPAGFRGALRPYQARGLGWLSMMSELGLGACLADDMGLGKTIQLLAFLLAQRARRPRDGRRALLVCPTSVVGNWEREAARFAPDLPVVRHHGPERAGSAAALDQAPPGALVVTTYGLLRRDAELLAGVEWSVAALDEAQNIKNPGSRAARAARALRAEFRVALTGTPVENHLGELWSLSEYLNPRLLGPLERFRREVAVPIERHGRDDVAEGLRRVIRPFLLRREKSDPAVVRDLPAKQESTVACTLTREQASLYRAAVDEALRRIESTDGMQRRGLVLALITALKQICNHPAHYLGQPGPLPGRSGKLDRLREMLEEIVEAGDRALVFTQFREMGDRLVAELERALGAAVPFLHGGVGRAARDAMVERFQADGGPPVLVLSLRAGGTGLNLTAASHVFHFDRWWNPAVEDQATDRAHRIGQRRAVQVHRLVCAGTMEERVGEVLEKKRGLASRIVGRGEQWVTELDDEALRDLFSLAPDAVIGDEEAEAGTGSNGRAAGSGPAKARRRARRGEVQT